MGRETNRQRREKQAATAREKAAAARASQARVDQRRRARAILSSVVAAAVVIALIAVIAITHKSTQNDAGGNRVVATAPVVKDVTHVSPSTFQTVGAGSAQQGITKISQPPLNLNGKPELFFIGGEFCPICAAERWSIAVALSRFGTFSDLKMVHSAVDDGDLATLDFYKSSYTSKYLSFVAVENADRNRETLQALTSAQSAVYKGATGTTQLGYPFLDFGGKYLLRTEGYDGSVLGTMTQAQIASQLNDPSSDVSKAVVGEANNLTAAICEMTGGQPGSVCTSPEVTAAQSKLSA